MPKQYSDNMIYHTSMSDIKNINKWIKTILSKYEISNKPAWLNTLSNFKNSSYASKSMLIVFENDIIYLYTSNYNKEVIIKENPKYKILDFNLKTKQKLYKLNN